MRTTSVSLWKDYGLERSSRTVMQEKLLQPQRYSQLNDVIGRAVKNAQIPASKVPATLLRTDGKRSDGATLIPKTRGKALAWNVTVYRTLSLSPILTVLPDSWVCCKSCGNFQDFRVRCNDVNPSSLHQSLSKQQVRGTLNPLSSFKNLADEQPASTQRITRDAVTFSDYNHPAGWL